jgi:uncharacterized protein YbjQ (UPF0145 family)
MTTCPACHREIQPAAPECPYCGVILAKWKGYTTSMAGSPQHTSTANAPSQERRISYIPHTMVTTALTLDGYRIVQTIGLVRGLVCRSRSIVGSFFAGLQTIFGGDITLYTQLCEQARADAYDRMVQHAQELGANAVIGVRYDATEVMAGVTEVLCYGTAVKVAS